MKYFIGCFVSAFLGAWLAVSWLDSEPRNQVVAQEQRLAQNSDKAPIKSKRFQTGKAPRGPRFPGADTREPDENRTRLAFNENGLTPEEQINVAVYEHVNRGVVNITTKSVGGGFFLLEATSEGTGSGSVIDKAGHILTNYHVIEDARQVSVMLFNGKTYEATLTGADPQNDVAVIKIDAPPNVLFPIEMGESGHLRVGMRVFAIGNPFGLERTMTTGIISSLNRTLKIHGNRRIRSIIQIDAAVNPGNSGGPLLDTHGNLIGINTAIASRTGQSAGVGFAIPVNMVSRYVPQLIEHGRVIRPSLGIASVYRTDAGLLITQLTPRGPAEQAGLQGPKVIRQRRGPIIITRIDHTAADLIVEVDGKEMETNDDLQSYIESRKTGDRVELTIIREGRRMKVPVVLTGDDETTRPPRR